MKRENRTVSHDMHYLLQRHFKSKNKQTLQTYSRRMTYLNIPAILKKLFTELAWIPIIASILGTDEAGHANFIKFNYKGGGAVFLQLAPMTFTNFFLLYKNNKNYYDNAFSYLPKSIVEIKWDDYFRYPHYSNFFLH